MALIENSKVKETSGGYERLFNHHRLGSLVSRLQSTVISAGTELERLILERVTCLKDEEIDGFLKLNTMPEGVRVLTKRQIIKCSSFDHSIQAEPDLVIFKRRDGSQNCYVIEPKDGHVFDTKKALAERSVIHSFIERNGHRLNCTVSSHICCFNQEDPHIIYQGLKKKIPLEEILTGPQLCELLEISWHNIVSVRTKDGEQNITFFLKELLGIKEIREKIKELMNAT